MVVVSPLRPGLSDMPGAACPPRLAAFADGLLRRKLSLLRAPAGYGKSTALKALHDVEAATSDFVSFFAVDARDNEPARFLARLGQVLDIPDPSDLASAAMLGDRLNQGGKHLLFVDGFDEICNSDVRQMLGDLLRFAEPLHAVMAVRVADFPFLSRMRSRDALATAGPELLRLSKMEAIAYLGEPPGVDLLTLIDHAEGWPILLKFIRDGLRAGDPAASAGQVGTISGDLIIDFVESEILAPLEEDERRLLIGTSLLARFSAPLAQILLPATNVDGAIETLTRRHGLLHARRGRDLWFEINPIVRGALLRLLSAENGPAMRTLHHLAEGWMLEHDAGDQAMLHACLAEDYDECGDMIREIGPAALGMRYGLGALRSVLSHMPERFMAEPSLAISRALIFSKEGRVTDARRLLGEVRSRIGTVPGLMSRATAADLSLLEVMLLCHSDQQLPGDLVERLRTISDQTPATDLIRQGWIQNMLCRIYLGVGDLTAAAAAATSAQQYYARSDSYFGEFFVHVHIASVRSWQNLPRETAEHLDAAEQLASRYFSDEPTLLTIVQLLRAEYQFDWGSRCSDEDLLGALQVVENNDGWLDLFLSGYRTAAFQAFTAGDIDAAFSALRRGEEAAARLALPRLAVCMRIFQVELWTFVGDRSRASKMLRRIRLNGAGGGDEDAYWRERLSLGIASSRLLIHSNQFKRAAASLDALQTEATSRNAMRVVRKAQILSAILLSRSGRPQAAIDLFAVVLEATSNAAPLRAYVEEGELMVRLCALMAPSAQRNHLSPHGQDLFERIWQALACFERQAVTSEAATYLSSKEQQVLLNLSEGHPNKEIASRINVSEATVKFHLQAIYRKLGANNRVRALAIAHEQGLLY
ncbi:helix-turn-helix transcriptional regulator [Sphingosinicella rhizophila]|uniref:LuxR C-terminal-related transcriptional regulator n=1 Tax=Sphingosinicella rhizophila TaxID=3050082 RepID=A0ABU3Q5W6_9SPHN|nr:LuxR C-terminal-related transcriptional regulator [Sphingosinicella sp. GR2756]MDT9598799.1 LuxR C-terminal-related transcriptional regulator [Sphingosinicella sp. GR2756]